MKAAAKKTRATAKANRWQRLLALRLEHPGWLKLGWLLGAGLVMTATIAYPIIPKYRPSQAPAVLSAPLLSPTECQGRTVVNIVAHEDDDLLFMNPSISEALKAGSCLRTVYLTGGDSGAGDERRLSRQAGVEAAYDVMVGNQEFWQNQSVTIDGHSLEAVSPSGNPKLSLLFLNLPDGNLTGSGFPSDSGQSLAKLWDYRINSISDLRTGQQYSHSDLTLLLADLMQAYRPRIVNLQKITNQARSRDHSDHRASGQFGLAAARLYVRTGTPPAGTRLSAFSGYDIAKQPTNLSPADISAKAAAYAAYAAYDPVACHSYQICQAAGSVYADYLTRQYVQTIKY